MKKLLAAAIATAVAAPATALAENNVTIYGKIHMELVNDDIDEYGGSTSGFDAQVEKDSWRVGQTTSRLGFKGSEDLGNGLKAIWKYEMEYDGLDGDGDGPVGAGDAIGPARNSYVGFSGDWGTFLIGRHDTPFKVAWYAAGNDHIDASIIDFNTIGPYGTAFDELRANNTITYISPSFNGLTVAASIIPGEEAENDPGGSNADGIADHYSLGVMWKANGIKASAGFESLEYDDDDNTTIADDRQNTWFVGGSYTLNNLTVGGSVLGQQDVEGTSDDKTAYGISAKYAFGNNAVIANATGGEIDADANNSDTDFYDWGIAFEHTFSKRTSVYAAYNYAEIDQEGDGENESESKQYGLGIIHLF